MPKRALLLPAIRVKVFAIRQGFTLEIPCDVWNDKAKIDGLIDYIEQDIARAARETVIDRLIHSRLIDPTIQ